MIDGNSQYAFTRDFSTTMIITPRKNLHLEATARFTVLSSGIEVEGKHKNLSVTQPLPPSRQGLSEATKLPPRFCPVDLADLLLHEHRSKSDDVHQKLVSSLRDEGFCFLTTSREGALGKLILQLRQSLNSDLFPGGDVSGPENCVVEEQKGENLDQNEPLKNRNVAKLPVSKHLYISEKGVPMYRLGYELTEDGVREIFRVAAGRPDDVVWTSADNQSSNEHVRIRSVWLRGLGLLRHITDMALDLLLYHQPRKCTASAVACSEHGSSLSKATLGIGNAEVVTRRRRPLSSSSAWRNEPAAAPLMERPGDFSVLYAMHYFNEEGTDLRDHKESENAKKGMTTPGRPAKIAVKEHVDPSLLVCEPFLCEETTGLQVWDRRNSRWMDCDGPAATSMLKFQDGEESNSCVVERQNSKLVLLLFVGKALANTSQGVLNPPLEATMHRVVGGDRPRKTVIYEQKYEEYFPPPCMD